MSRRHTSEQAEILPDAKYKDVVLTKLMNCVMIDGKKSIAENIVYGALDIASKSLKKEQIDVFRDALSNVIPNIEVKSRRVGGATYQVPVEVSNKRGTALAIRWLVIAAKKRSEKTMMDRLAKELMDAVNNRGAAHKKKEDTHKMAEANKAFAHFRW